MFFSKSCEYALRATMYLAKIEEDQKTSIQVIAKELDMPADYLNKVLQILVKSDIISSAKGRNGGFFLTKNSINQPLIRIVHAIDGEEVFRKCGLGINDCSSDRPCPLHNDIKAYRENLRLALSSNSIASTRTGTIAGETYLSR
ncbi:MAG: Rrf2 family transcriptional regulator [Crocinitomicaceae bacterium]|nr:Rrf2 family transcriptional regulator [Crocinitomicaceae bacterium]